MTTSTEYGGWEDWNGTVEPRPEYQVIGHNMQVLNVKLSPGKSIATEPGTMMHMSSSINTDTTCECCSFRCCTESCVKVTYTNGGNSDSFIGLTPNFPSKVVPIDIGHLGTPVLAVKGAYMASVGIVNVSCDLDVSPLTCCCAGVGFLRQKLTGEGIAFVCAGGTVLQKTLLEGETIVVDTDGIVAWQETVTMGIRPAGWCCFTCLFGGEGCCNTTMVGPGLVILQSMSYHKWRNSVKPPTIGPPPVQDKSASKDTKK